jgi:hypothetical protein
MPLTATFVKNEKHSGNPAGDKHADGGGMYLLVNASGKYWRMNYRFTGKRKTLALGVYPEVRLIRPEGGAKRPGSYWPMGLTPAPPSVRKSWPRRARPGTPSRRLLWNGMP